MIHPGASKDPIFKEDPILRSWVDISFGGTLFNPLQNGWSQNPTSQGRGVGSTLWKHLINYSSGTRTLLQPRHQNSVYSPLDCFQEQGVKQTTAGRTALLGSCLQNTSSCWTDRRTAHQICPQPNLWEPWTYGKKDLQMIMFKISLRNNLPWQMEIILD